MNILVLPDTRYHPREFIRFLPHWRARSMFFASSGGARGDHTVNFIQKSFFRRYWGRNRSGMPVMWGNFCMRENLFGKFVEENKIKITLHNIEIKRSFWFMFWRGWKICNRNWCVKFCNYIYSSNGQKDYTCNDDHLKRVFLTTCYVQVLFGWFQLVLQLLTFFCLYVLLRNIYAHYVLWWIQERLQYHMYCLNE